MTQSEKDLRMAQSVKEGMIDSMAQDYQEAGFSLKESYEIAEEKFNEEYDF